MIVISDASVALCFDSVNLGSRPDWGLNGREFFILHSGEVPGPTLLQLDYLNEAIDRLPVKRFPAAAFSLEIAETYSGWLKSV